MVKVWGLEGNVGLNLHVQPQEVSGSTSAHISQHPCLVALRVRHSPNTVDSEASPFPNISQPVAPLQQLQALVTRQKYGPRLELGASLGTKKA